MSFQTEALTHSRGEEVTVFSFSLKGKAGDGEKSVACAYERDHSASFLTAACFQVCGNSCQLPHPITSLALHGRRGKKINKRNSDTRDSLLQFTGPKNKKP